MCETWPKGVRGVSFWTEESIGSPIPVFPAVPSTIVPPGLILPERRCQNASLRYSVATPQLTSCFGIFHYPQSCSILHRAAWVHEFRLRWERSAQLAMQASSSLLTHLSHDLTTSLFRKPFEPDLGTPSQHSTSKHVIWRSLPEACCPLRLRSHQLASHELPLRRTSTEAAKAAIMKQLSPTMEPRLVIVASTPLPTSSLLPLLRLKRRNEAGNRKRPITPSSGNSKPTQLSFTPHCTEYLSRRRYASGLANISHVRSVLPIIGNNLWRWT